MTEKERKVIIKLKEKEGRRKEETGEKIMVWEGHGK